MDLISKKELLEETGISYGQLYRWKREDLIPENWFIKKSSYTGQETFFPREDILYRIKTILVLKDQYSLEELAKMLSPENSGHFTKQEVCAMEEIDPEIGSRIEEVCGTDFPAFNQVAFTAALCHLTGSREINTEQKIRLLKSGSAFIGEEKKTAVFCTLFLVGEEYRLVFTNNPNPLSFGQDVTHCGTVSVTETGNQLKAKYMQRA